MKMVVKGFQSIGSSVLDCVGFTVVTGDSNLGKSALLRSVQAAVFGLPGDYYVRRGVPIAEVGVRFDPTLVIKWRKVPPGKKIPGRETQLDINGTVHTKLGRDHDSLTKPLGFLSIPTAAGELRPQFAGQFDKAFLLDVTPSVVAEVFKVLGRGDVVATAQDASKKDKLNAERSLAIRKSDLDVAERRVEGLRWTPAFSQKIAALKREFGTYDNNAEALAQVTEWLAVQIPERIPNAPAIPDLREGFSLLAALESFKEWEVPRLPIDEVCAVRLRLLEDLEAFAIAETLLSVELKAWESALAQATKELDEVRLELKVCPLCEQPFGGSHA